MRCDGSVLMKGVLWDSLAVVGLFSSFLFLLPLFVSFFLLLFFFVFRREIDRVSLYNPLLVLTLLETGVFRARPRLLEDCFALLSLLLESDLTQGHGWFISPCLTSVGLWLQCLILPNLVESSS